MSTFEEDEIDVTEVVEFVEGRELEEEKKVENRLSVGKRDYGYALVVVRNKCGIWSFS